MQTHLAEGIGLFESGCSPVEHKSEHPAIADRRVGSIIEFGVEDDGVGKGPLVMKVLLPLSTYSSPSRRAVAVIPPRASDPEFGSVMAHAPILSAVSRSRPHRSIWAGVPSFMTVPAANPTLTPMAVTMPGQ